ncbi:hypothetical protein AALO_G00235130 [Alosa alosa]|uniref:G-protein coupled receptors family 1 profile domain-containing protein n=1 Tax=Alosa alosa TaxID=278164 RepID=A0AAV6FV56_9TELE|nr:5-hydroxytryptamine receptor 1F isoform X1 [Alosa alosa]KAG5266699.1 hypothetical protein AALO_G00235130 [Alosa alosa]
MDPPDNRWFDANDPLAIEMRLVRNLTASRLNNFSPRAKLILEVLMVLMCVGAVTGNILVILIVAATKTFHSVTSILIINLAISDFLVGIGVMPFVAVSIMNNGWVDCNDLCLYVGYTSSVYCTASVLTLAAIALDRYYSIVDCLRYSSRCTVWRTGAAVLWIWVQAAITSCPPLLGWGMVDYVAPMFSCAVKWSSSTTYTVFMATASFLLPATVILFCYVKIVRVARNHARRIHSLEDQLNRNRRCPVAPPPSTSATEGQDSHAPTSLVYYLSGGFLTESSMDGGGSVSSLPDSQATHSCSESRTQPSSASNSTSSGSRRLHTFIAQLQSSGTQPHNPTHPSQSQSHGVVRLFMVIAAFFLCWMPYMGVAMVQATEKVLSRPSSLVPQSAITFSYWLVLLNSDINPLLYALLSKRFQGALKSLQQKIQARLGGLVGRDQERAEGEARRDGSPCFEAAPSHHLPQGGDCATPEGTTTYTSVFTLSSSQDSCRECAGDAPVCEDEGPRRLSCLRVPSQQHVGDRLPCSAATQERQATFFYGQITVRVEHDIC